MPLNSKTRSQAADEREGSFLPVNNLSTQSLNAAHGGVWNHYVPLQEVHKEVGQDFE